MSRWWNKRFHRRRASGVRVKRDAGHTSLSKALVDLCLWQTSVSLYSGTGRGVVHTNVTRVAYILYNPMQPHGYFYKYFYAPTQARTYTHRRTHARTHAHTHTHTHTRTHARTHTHTRTHAHTHTHTQARTQL